jgi:threonine/homoserine/homoserine lactone efflux protein
MTGNFYLLSFLWGLWWSFVFSLPPGIINLSVLDATVRKHLKSGIILASAACIIEFVQSFIGAKFSAWFAENEIISLVIKIAIIPVFLGLAIKYLAKSYHAFQRQKAGVKEQDVKRRIGSFGKGLLVGLLNPIAIPFFLVLAAKSAEEGLLRNTWTSIFIYVIGTTIGTFLAFLAYGILSRFIAKKLQAITLWLDLVIGIIFGILSIEQSVVLLIKYF